jgi:hypothetical protein
MTHKLELGTEIPSTKNILPVSPFHGFLNLACKNEVSKVEVKLASQQGMCPVLHTDKNVHSMGKTPQLSWKLLVIRGIFCDGTRWNAILEVLSQKDASWNSIPEPFFLALV